MWGRGLRPGAGPVYWDWAGSFGILATAAAFPLLSLKAVNTSHRALGLSVGDMGDKIIEAINLYSSEDDNMALDVDFYDQDIYDIPDPGVLIEKNGEGT